MKYSMTQKQQIIERYQNGEAVSSLSAETSMPPNTMYSWVNPYRSTTTETGYVVTPMEFILMKRKIEKHDPI